MTPFRKSSSDETSTDTDAPQVTREVDTPETQARDAVANGSGALTKRTVERNDDNKNSVSTPRQDVPVPEADTQSDYDRGQDVLRQFRELDAGDSQSTQNPPAQTATEQQSPIITSTLNYHEGHGIVYWLFVIIFVVVAAGVVAKKFLFTDKPALTKSQLFDDSSEKLRTTVDKVKPAPTPRPARQPSSSDKIKATADKIKPVTPPPKPARPPKDDDKGKHFEIRV